MNLEAGANALLGSVVHIASVISKFWIPCHVALVSVVPTFPNHQTIALFLMRQWPQLLFSFSSLSLFPFSSRPARTWLSNRHQRCRATHDACLELLKGIPMQLHQGQGFEVSQWELLWEAAVLGSAGLCRWVVWQVSLGGHL